MNRQSDTGILWTRVYGRPGFTWNVITGCDHACEWFAGDNEEDVIECYAKVMAESRMLESHYPQGFAFTQFYPERLEQPKRIKKPAGIFLDSMSDIMSKGVKDEWIEQVLEVCRQTPQHIYLLLTKNAPRLREFDFPPNVWVGVSCPPDSYKGKRWTINQKRAYMFTTLDILSSLKVPIRWISFEPLNGYYADIMRSFNMAVQWAVIGAASKRGKLYPPKVKHFTTLMKALRDEQFMPVFFKHNMKCLPEAANDWYDMFPDETMADSALFDYNRSWLIDRRQELIDKEWWQK